MGDKSDIQWTDASWNPTRGCSIVSTGCENCYAMKQAARFDYEGGPYDGLTRYGGCRCDAPGQLGQDGRCSECGSSFSKRGPLWSGKLMLVHEKLDQPLRWKKPRRIFVNSMSDLFHEDVPDEFIRKVFEVMVNAHSLNGHTFQVLTKRPARMREVVSKLRYAHGGPAPRQYSAGRWHMVVHLAYFDGDAQLGPASPEAPPDPWKVPPGIHLGVSCEDQKAADKRIPELLATPAAVRFVSAEPLLGSIRFTLNIKEETPRHDGQWWLSHNTLSGFRATSPQSGIDGPGLDWVIVGGESGPRARPCDVAWIRSIVEQCKAADVACFVKQLGSKPYERCQAREVVPNEARQTARNGWFTRPGAQIQMKHPKGGDIEEFPEDLRVRQFPEQREDA